MRGVTLVEILIVIAVTLIVLVAIPPFYGSIVVKTDLDESTKLLTQYLRLAHNKSGARLNDTAHGIFFDTANSYVIYEGNSYSTATFTQTITLSTAIAISMSISGTGDADDINFSKGLGAPNKTGTVMLTGEGGETRIITITGFGTILE